MGTYNVKLDNKGHEVVLDGDWAGELVGACDGKNNLTMRIPGVHLSKEEARNIRTELELNEIEFHLDFYAPRKGTYCFYFDNKAINNDLYENFQCSYVGESSVPWYFKQTPFIRHLPFGSDSRCIKFKKAIRPYTDEYSNFADKAEDGLIIGAGFAVAAVAIDRLLKKLTGKSLIDRFRNGNGPKGPGEPPAPSSPSSPQPTPARNAPPAPEGSEPSEMVRLPDIPPPKPWQVAVTAFTASALTALAVGGKIIEGAAYVGAYVYSLPRRAMMSISGIGALFEDNGPQFDFDPGPSCTSFDRLMGQCENMSI